MRRHVPGIAGVPGMRVAGYPLGASGASGAARTGYRSKKWVIVYDTPSDRRRRKLAKLLKGYGLRVQCCVFEGELRGVQMQRLRQRLELLFVAEQDSVSFWRVPEQGCAQRLHLGRTAPSPEWEDRLI